MVYDRGRSAPRRRDSSGFGSSGSPRERFPSDAGSAYPKSRTQNRLGLNPAPNRESIHLSAPKQPATDKATATNFYSETRNFVDLISERVFWFIQRDTADKKLKKLDNDVQRCQNSEFHSAVGLLETQSKAAEVEKAKIAQRITKVDHQLQDSAMSLWFVPEPAHERRFTNEEPQSITPPPSETSCDATGLDEKLAQLRSEMESKQKTQMAQMVQMTEEYRKLQTRITEESRRLQTQIEEQSQQHSKAKLEYEQQICDFRQRLDQEQCRREKLERLQTQIDEQSQQHSRVKLEHEQQMADVRQRLYQEQSHREKLEKLLQDLMSRLSSIETKTENHLVSTTNRLDEMVKQGTLDSVEARLAKVEALQTPVSVPSPQAPDDQKMNFDAYEPTKSIQLEDLETKIKDILNQSLFQKPDMIFSSESILRLASSVEEKLQSSLSRMAHAFGVMIDKERSQRASLEVKIATSVKSIATVEKELQTVKTEVKTTDTQLQTVENKVQTVQTEVKAVETQLQTARSESWDRAKELARMQVTSRISGVSEHETAREQTTQLQNVNHSVDLMRRDIEAMKLDSRHAMDAMCMRLQHVSAWQNNFAGKHFYDAMVAHLNDTILREHINALRELRMRVQSLEGLIMENNGNKRRKTSAFGGFQPTPPAAG